MKREHDYNNGELCWCNAERCRQLGGLVYYIHNLEPDKQSTPVAMRAAQEALSYALLAAQLHRAPDQKGIARIIDEETGDYQRRYLRNLKMMGEVLAPVREYRETGEPKYSDVMEVKTLINAKAELVEALSALEKAEALYRYNHDLYGRDSLRAGRAWDELQAAGDTARAALAKHGVKENRKAKRRLGDFGETYAWSGANNRIGPDRRKGGDA